MLVLKLCQQLCPDKIPLVPTNKLGDGADGEVFDVEGHEDLVIKFSVLYETGSTKARSEFKHIKKVLDYFQSNHVPTHAHVFAFEQMGEFEREIAWSNKKQPFILYYYTMEKLFKLSEDERKVFHTILCHEDRGIKKNYSPQKIREILKGMQAGLDFDMERVTFFVDNFKNVPINHLDIHVRNIMKDPQGSFKLIDFDRAQFRR